MDFRLIFYLKNYAKHNYFFISILIFTLVHKFFKNLMQTINDMK